LQSFCYATFALGGIPPSAKCEKKVYLNEYQSIGELIVDVDDYIEFYNHRRFYETLGYRKPMDVYRESSIKSRKGKGFLKWTT